MAVGGLGRGRSAGLGREGGQVSSLDGELRPIQGTAGCRHVSSPTNTVALALSGASVLLKPQFRVISGSTAVSRPLVFCFVF